MAQVKILHPVDDPACTVSLAVDGPFDPHLANVQLNKLGSDFVVVETPNARFVGSGVSIRAAVDKAIIELGHSHEFGNLKPLVEAPLKQRVEAVPTVDLRQGDMMSKVYAVIEVIVE